MANKEISPPGGDLGVSTGGREALANFMAMKNILGDRGRGGREGGLFAAFRGGRTKRQMLNDMKMYQFMRQVDDQAARAADARKLQVSAADAAWNTANYLKGVAAGTGQGQTDENGNAVLMNSVNDVFGPITAPNKNVLPDQFTAKSSLGSVFAGTNPVRPGGPSPEEPPGEEPPAEGEPTTEDLPLVMHGPAHPFEGGRVKKITGRGGKKGVRVSEAKLTESEQRDIPISDLNLIADETGVDISDASNLDMVRQEAIRRRLPISSTQAKSLSPSQKKKNEAWIEKPAPVKPLGLMFEDASIDTGEVGSRPQPGGENGIVEGTQFK